MSKSKVVKSVKKLTMSDLKKEVEFLKTKLSNLEGQMSTLNSIINRFVMIDKDQGLRVNNPYERLDNDDLNKYEKIPYWMRPDFKMPPVMCSSIGKCTC